MGWNGGGEIKGSGLGSRIIKAMVQTVQGELHYENEGRGTSAVITIRCERAERSPTPPQVLRETAARKAIRP